MNFDKKISLTSNDFELLYKKEHPLQRAIAKKYSVQNTNDLFGLPQPYMLAMDTAELTFEKGTGKYGRGFATATLEITQEDPWFWCHFLGDPVMPGSQGQDAFIQLAGTWGAFSGEIFGRARALEGDFRFIGQILPTCKKIYYRIDINRFLKKKRLLFFDGHIAADDPQNIIYEFGVTKLGFYTSSELSIPKEKITDYYNPDWDAVRQNALRWIDNAEKYYKKDTEE